MVHSSSLVLRFLDQLIHLIDQLEAFSKPGETSLIQNGLPPNSIPLFHHSMDP